MKKLFDTYRQMWTVVEQDEAGFWPGMLLVVAHIVVGFLLFVFLVVSLTHFPTLGKILVAWGVTWGVFLFLRALWRIWVVAARTVAAREER